MIVLNVNGLIDKRDMLALYVNKTNPSIVITVESHTKEEDEDALLVIQGYSHIRCDSDTRHTGGIVIYVVEDLSYELVFKNVRPREWWMLAIKLYMNYVLLGTFMGVYRSPRAGKGEFIDNFSVVMTDLLELSQKDCIIGGDINIDWLKDDEYYTKRLKSSIMGVGMKQIVEEATRVTPHSETLIDLVITDNTSLKSIVLDQPRISDHSIVSIVGIVNQRLRGKDKFLMKGKIDYEKLIEVMKIKIESRESDNKDIREEYEALIEDIKRSIQKTRKPDMWVRYEPCPWFPGIYGFL